MSVSDLQGSRILLDSNLTVLLCAGMVGPDQVARHKRLSAFDNEDFGLLFDIIEDSGQLIITPNVATEASNLLRQARENVAQALSLASAKVVEEGEEYYIESASAAKHAAYPWLGLTDAVLLKIVEAHSDVVLLTVDHHLHVTALSRGRKAVNFNHLRDQRPDFQR